MMKRIACTFSLVALLGSTAPLLAAETTATFDVAKMTCGTCPLTVRIAMERVDGVIDVDVDYEAKVAIVTFDDTRATPDEIAEASTNVGFPATFNHD